MNIVELAIASQVRMKTLISLLLTILLLLTLACRSPHDERFGIDESVKKVNPEAKSKAFITKTYPDYTADRLYFKKISLDSSGLVQWTLRKPAKPNVKFEIQEFRWNKYMTIASLDSVDISSSYSYQVDASCGLYEIRVLAIDGSKHYSRTISYPAPPDVRPTRHSVRRVYRFTRKTKYEIYDEIGFKVAGGCGTEVIIDELPRGKYYINYGNNMGMFLKKYSGANAKICNTRFLVKLDSIIEIRKSLHEKHVAFYFRNMSSECTTNVEFSQMNNELMFKVLKFETKVFIDVLGQYKKRTVLDYVITELEKPIHDGIDLDEVLTQIENVTVEDTVTKQLVLEAVRIAARKLQ